MWLMYFKNIINDATSTIKFTTCWGGKQGRTQDFKLEEARV